MNILPLIIATGVALGGCASEKKRAYDQLSSAINPVIAKLRPASGLVLGTHDDHVSVYRACSSADDVLRLLSDAPIQASLAAVNPPGMRGLSLPQYARELLQRRGERCAVVGKSCSEFCWWGWQGMVDEVRRLQAGAEVLHVVIVDLGP